MEDILKQTDGERYWRINALNSFLQLKEWHREELETEISRIQKVINDHEERLKTLETDFMVHIEQFRRHHQDEAMSPERIQSFHSYLEGMNGRMRKERESIMKRLEELRGKKEKLLSIYKEKMVVEKLMERHIAEVRKMSTRREQKEMDFISNQRYLR